MLNREQGPGKSSRFGLLPALEVALVLDEQDVVRGHAVVALVAAGGKVIFMRPCVFHSRLSIQNKRGGMKMTAPPKG